MSFIKENLSKTSAAGNAQQDSCSWRHKYLNAGADGACGYSDSRPTGVRGGCAVSIPHTGKLFNTINPGRGLSL